MHAAYSQMESGNPSPLPYSFLLYRLQDDTISSLEARATEAGIEARQLRTQLRSITEELEVSRIRVGELVSSSRSLHRRLEEAELEHGQLKSTADRLSHAAASAKQQLVANADELAVKTERERELVEAVQAAAEVIQGLQVQATAASAELAVKESELQQLHQQQLALAKATPSPPGCDVTPKKQQAYEDTISQLTQQLSEMEDELRTAMARISQLEEVHCSAVAAVMRHESQSSDVLSGAAALEEENRGLREEAERLRAASAGADARAAELGREVTKVQERWQQAQQAWAEADGVRTEREEALMLQLEEVRQECERGRVAVSALQEQCKDLEAQLAARQVETGALSQLVESLRGQAERSDSLLQAAQQREVVRCVLRT